MNKPKIFGAKGRIVTEILGRNKYTNYKQALNEAVANSLDAKSTRIEILLKNGCIEVIDDGIGMSGDDLINRYFMLGEKNPNRSARALFGIGVCANAALGDLLTVETRLKGQKEGIKATVDFNKVEHLNFQMPDLIMTEEEKAKKTKEEIKRHGKSPLLIIAGPGTGKSTALAERVAFLIKKGVRPERIYVLSFTNASALDLKEKIEGETPNAAKVSLSTVHGLANKISGENSQFGYFISNKYDDLLIIRDSYPSLSDAERKEFLKNQNKILATQKNNASVDGKYTLFKNYYRSFNFYEVTQKATQVLQDRRILNAYLTKMEYLIVDEYQDLNKADQALIEILSSSKEVGATLCGDDDQSIYGFRHANPQKLIDLHSSGLFSIKTMEFCFRSPRCIIEIAHPIINQLTKLGVNRIQKKPFARDSGDTVEIISLPSATEKRNKEAEWVLNKIQEIISKPDIDNILILASEPAITKELKQLLKNEKILIRTKREKILKKKETKQIYYSIRFIEDKTDNLAVRWVMELSEKNIDLSSVLGLAVKNNLSLIKVIREFKSNLLQKKTNEILSRLSRIDKTGRPSEIIEIVRNLYRIDTGDSAYCQLLKLAQKSKDLKEILEKISVEFLDIEDYESEDFPKDKKFVEIMTMHSSKGLTRDAVFIMGAEETFIPKYTNLTADEVRLFYVTLTRARKKLFITSVRSRKTSLARGNYIRKRSRFVDLILGSVDSKYVSFTKL